MYQNKSRFAKVLGIASTVFLVIYTIFSVFPLIWMVIISFKSDVDMFKTLFIFKPTLDNFRNVLTTGNYVKAFGDNFIICSGAVLVSVIVGVALTRPISSAAICAALGLTGLAGGAAVAGCCAQMVGFAVMSFKENRWGGLVSQGIGTSMLQMGNIVRNPRVWIAPIVTSAITGPLATCLFHLQMNGAPVSSGMGTCGLVGQIGVYTGWVADVASGAKSAITTMDWVGLILISFVLPAVLCPLINMVVRKLGWVKDGDLTLSND